MHMGICEYLEWDSSFFGIRIARLSGHRLTREGAEEAARWCFENRIDCAYFLADADDPETAFVAQRSGFDYLDTRLTLECPVPGSVPPPPSVRPFQASDAEPLRAIARVSHRDSRFYFDPRFPRERCDALYEAWIERSAAGWADAVLVAECDGEAAGYVSCHLGLDTGSIGLLAVAPARQGRGMGRRLVEAALVFFKARGMSRATVVTQGRNVASQRLYQGCGFRTHAVQLWYHRWFDRDTAI